MDQQILVPDIGDYSGIEIIEVVAKVGDHLKKDDTMITLETDKATMDIPAPTNLTIVQLHVKPGDKVSKGSLIATVKIAAALDATELGRGAHRDQQAGSSPHAQSVSSVIQAQSDPVTIDNESSSLKGFSNASPSIRKLARELGVDLENVSGTHKHGRIASNDVKQYVNNILTNNLAARNTNNLNNMPNINMDFSKWGTTVKQPLSRIKKKSGQHLHRNWVSIPHVTHFDTADITGLEKFRREQQLTKQAEGIKLTPLIFFIKAIVNGLIKYPNFNSSLSENGEDLIVKQYYNIGIAVDTDFGLVVPVVKNADQKNIFQLAEELTLLSQKARDNKLAIDDMQGGCFTISSLGGIGGVGFTPIINAPEVAILGVSRHKTTPVYIMEVLQPRIILPLALSYDHRVIDGAEAAKFSKFIVQQLEDLKNFYEPTAN